VLVSRRIPTAAARVRAQVRSCGICGGWSGTGAGFLRVLRFPLPILIPSAAPHSSSIIRGWYNRPVSGRHTKWTQSHPTQRNQKENKLKIVNFIVFYVYYLQQYTNFYSSSSKRCIVRVIWNAGSNTECTKYGVTFTHIPDVQPNDVVCFNLVFCENGGYETLSHYSTPYNPPHPTPPYGTERRHYLWSDELPPDDDLLRSKHVVDST
jgi:hypothetical protein